VDKNAVLRLAWSKGHEPAEFGATAVIVVLGVAEAGFHALSHCQRLLTSWAVTYNSCGARGQQ
jgi:hypothetical protein